MSNNVRDLIKEYLRPWKLATLAIGLSILIAGALYYKASDWDIGISLIMGLLTYFTAPWGFRVIKSLQWKSFPIVVLAYWVTVDGSYTAYNAHLGNPISGDLRWANFIASSLLYGLCGWFWSPNMTLREYIAEVLAVFAIRKKRGKTGSGSES